MSTKHESGVTEHSTVRHGKKKKSKKRSSSTSNDFTVASARRNFEGGEKARKSRRKKRSSSSGDSSTGDSNVIKRRLEVKSKSSLDSNYEFCEASKEGELNNEDARIHQDSSINKKDSKRGCEERSKVTISKKLKKSRKRKRSSSRSSYTSDDGSSQSSSTSGTSSDDSSERRRKRRKRKKKLAKKMAKREEKKRKEERRKLKKLAKDKFNESTGDIDCGTIKTEQDRLLDDINVELADRAKAMAPMTKEQWEKKQSVVRRVYDEETGRQRLIKGDGEVLEEIVSRDRHMAINRQATKGDGTFFQSRLRINK